MEASMAVAEVTKVVEFAKVEKEEAAVVVGGEEDKAPVTVSVGGEEDKAPVTVSVGGEEGKAPVTVSVGGEEDKAPVTVSVGGEENKTPVTVSVVDSANATSTATRDESQRKNNRIQVSNRKKPSSYYLKLAKKYIEQYNDVELSALGMAIPNVVLISDILKTNGFAVQKNIVISTVVAKENYRGQFFRKAKIEILLGKGDKMKQEYCAAACGQKGHNIRQKEVSPIGSS